MNGEKWWRQSVFVYRLERYFVHFNPVGDSVSSFDFFQLFIFSGYCYLVYDLLSEGAVNFTVFFKF